MRITHTSAQTIGQIYVPWINWVLMVSVLILVFAFETSVALAFAFGIVATRAGASDSVPGLLAQVVDHAGDERSVGTFDDPRLDSDVDCVTTSPQLVDERDVTRESAPAV